MRIDPTTTTGLPQHIARAYGVGLPQQPLAKIAPAQKAAPSDASNASPASDGTRRLVAGVVPGRVDFSGDQPRQATDALQFYHHPADRNAAATGVALGRKLDVQG